MIVHGLGIDLLRSTVSHMIASILIYFPWNLGNVQVRVANVRLMSAVHDDDDDT